MKAEMLGKYMQFKHRLVFIGIWTLLGIALVLLHAPLQAFIVGIWPFVLLAYALIGDANNSPVVLPLIILFGALGSGTAVGVCAWTMDRAHLTKKIWAVLLLIVVVGGASIHRLYEYNYEDWLNSPEISAAMEAAELHFTPTRKYFIRDVVIPKTLVGGIWGLYVTTALCAAYSAAKIFRRKLWSQKPKHASHAEI